MALPNLTTTYLSASSRPTGDDSTSRKGGNNDGSLLKTATANPIHHPFPKQSPTVTRHAKSWHGES